MNEKITIIMPMGGVGIRFKRENFKIEKPFLNINGTPLFLNTLKSFKKIRIINEIILIIRKNLKKDIKLFLDNRDFFRNKKFKIVVLNKKTRNPIETIIKSKAKVSNKKIICLDNDLYFKSSKYFKKIINKNCADSIVPTFVSDKNIYSFVKHKGKKVLDIKEKKIISKTAVAGAYFFRDKTSFFKQCEKINKSKKIKDKYISTVILNYIKNKKKVEQYKTEKYLSYGTPKEYLKNIEK